jgi:hypothetical protein
MTGGAGQAIGPGGPGGEARSVLRSAVADYGPQILSNAAILEGICEDRLPDSPREASLVSIAARADVAAMLEQQAGGVGPDTAVRLTAAALADSRSIDPAAAIWVVGEFARALGYQVSDGLQPAAGAAPAPPAPPAPPAAVAPAVAVPDAGPAPGVSPPAGPPGDDLTVPPTGVPHPATQRAGLGQQETVTTGQGAPQPGVQPAGTPAGGGYGWAPGPAAGQGMPPPGAPQGMPPPGAPQGMPPPGAPQAGAPAGGGYGWAPGQAGPPPGAPTAGGPMAPPGGPAGPGGFMGPPGAPPPGTRSPRRGLMLGIGAAVLVVIILIIVVLSQSSGSGKNNAGPTTSPGHSSHPTPSTSTSFQPTSGDLTLESLIPADVSANHACSPVQRPAFGATAEMHCVGGPKIPPDYVQYYLFSSTAAMNGAYSTFVTNFAQSHRDTGHCHQINGTSAFSTFSPCETQFSLGSTAEGRIAEYNYKGSPDISCTFTVDKVLVDMQASDGNTLIGWWDHSHNWINR